MAVVSMVVGAATPDGATFVAKVDGGGPVRVAVSEDSGMSSPVFTSSQAVDAQGVAKVSITGLDSLTRYWWQVEDNGVLDTGTTGQFRTHPPAGLAANFTVALAGDAGSRPIHPGVAGTELDAQRVSNHPVFDTIRTRAVTSDWLGFYHVGDLHYYNLGDDFTGDLANHRRVIDDVLAQPRQHQLYHSLPWQHIWDDHDFDGNNSDGTYAGKGSAAQAYREREPHYTLDDTDAIYQSWQIGRVLFVASDCRYYRSPNSDPDDATKTMLGSAQKTWFENLLSTSDAQVLVWLMSSQWMGTGDDSWAAFSTERDELVAMLGDHEWLDRMVVCYGDRHAAGISSGQPNEWGGFPVLLAASLDAASGSGGVNDPRFDVTSGSTPGRDQYGTIDVQDAGSAIGIRLNTWRGEDRLGTYAFGINVSNPVVAPGALLRTVAGSHRPTFEARVVETFQSGSDPIGTTIPILGGDVQMDGTADVERTLQLETAGFDETNGRNIFPRRTADLLAPYGNEIFVRRGVDLGGETIWFPLGYFRIESAEQDGAPDGPIRLSGSDRMAGIVEATPLQPREFEPTRTVASIFAELVGEVYADAIVVFDDDSGAAAIGRPLVMEDSRYDLLREIATSFGKIMSWDGAGVLQVRTAPVESFPLWEVKAGYQGVLVTARRRVTRDGVYNAVIATGESGDDGSAPAHGIAIDSGPNSPTRWGGRFGRVPRSYSSPFITTSAQAQSAAREILRRSIGAPYSVDFGAAPNPALQPHDPVRVTQRDGNRELHVMERLTIPLVAEATMSGSTKEKTFVVLGSLL